MIRLECDYAEGAHERVLRRLFETNLEQTPGYGEDAYCAQARARIRALCENEALDVHFLVGGTQTNTTVIAAALRPHQGVIAAASGHINVHETGAIEATGHKVLAVPSADGKLTALDVRRVWEAHWQDETREHMVQPGMVYLSQPTENGTLYSLAELDDLWQTCQDCGLFLYVDGARLGYGLMSPACDMTLPDLARQADRLALDLRRALEERGYAMLYDSPTNQQYPILPDELVEHLEADFAFSFWKKVDQDHTAVRLCTSWATEPAAIQALIQAVDRWEEG